jgi:hypothetical protein
MDGQEGGAEKRGMGRERAVSVESLKRAEELWARVKPIVAEAMERHGPGGGAVTFNEIEAGSAAVGDLLARMMMVEAVVQQGVATDEEVAAAREEAWKRAGADTPVEGGSEKLRMVRMVGRESDLKTARGELRYRREYLYFPEASFGVFPPGQTAGDPRG